MSRISALASTTQPPDSFQGLPLFLYPVNNPEKITNIVESRFALLMNQASYDIARARAFILFLTSIEKSFDLIVTSRQGSESTLLCCAAQSVYMTPRASVAPLDPTYRPHGYPVVVEGSLPFHYNPDEIKALSRLIDEVFTKDPQKGQSVLKHHQIDSYYASIEARLELQSWRQFLVKLLCNHVTQEKAQEAANFFTTGCGSADSLITANTLRHYDLPIKTLHTADGNLEYWKGQQNNDIEFLQWNWA